jgi:hypothetical protein
MADSITTSLNVIVHLGMQVLRRVLKEKSGAQNCCIREFEPDLQRKEDTES